MKLSRYLYQVAGEKVSHFYDASAYLVDLGSSKYLVDCGTPDGYEQIVENISLLGYSLPELDGIIATHGHYDHIGASTFFKRDYAIPLYLHPGDLEAVQSCDPFKTTAGLLYGRVFPETTIDELLYHGEEFRGEYGCLEIIHTPGHTPGSVSVGVDLDGVRILLAGDTLWGGYSEAIDSSEIDWKESLRLLKTYDFDLLSFGHSGPNIASLANDRISEASEQFAVYYNPWFKPMKRTFRF